MAESTPPGVKETRIIQGHIDVKGHVYMLDADPDPTGTGWVARVAQYAAQRDAAPVLRQVRDEHSQFHDLAEVSEEMQAEGPTAEAAIDALEAKIRAAVLEAIRAA